MFELLTVLIACLPPEPGFNATVPPSGTTIPANAKIVLLGYPHPDPRVTITRGGTTYDVQPMQENGIMVADIGALGVTGTISLSATVDDPSAMPLNAEFTVATTTDLAPPHFRGTPSLSFSYMEEYTGSCFRGGFHIRAEISPATDDWTVGYYELYEVLPNDELRHAGSAAHFDRYPTLVLHDAPGEEEGTRCYVAFAYDVAGNVTEERAGNGACIDLVLDGSDAGVDAGSADSGTKADSGTGGLRLDEEMGGCSCSVTSTAHSSGILPALLLLAFLRRKH